jgi:hypothetical protein
MTRSLSRIVLLLALAASTLVAQRAAIPQQLAFTPYRASGIYDRIVRGGTFTPRAWR